MQEPPTFLVPLVVLIAVVRDDARSAEVPGDY